jgi:hypothetical protein
MCQSSPKCSQQHLASLSDIGGRKDVTQNSRPNRVGRYHSFLGASELPHEALKNDSFVLDASRCTIGRLGCTSSLMNIKGYQDVKSVMTNAFRTFRGHAQRKRSVVADAEVTYRTLKMSSLHRQPKS